MSDLVIDLPVLDQLVYGSSNSSYRGGNPHGPLHFEPNMGPMQFTAVTPDAEVVPVREETAWDWIRKQQYLSMLNPIGDYVARNGMYPDGTPPQGNNPRVKGVPTMPGRDMINGGRG